jgi:hypothetical protein
MNNPFSLFDVIIILPMVVAMTSPDSAMRLMKIPPEQMEKWRPRARPVASVALLLFVASRFAFQALFPNLFSKI